MDSESNRQVRLSHTNSSYAVPGLINKGRGSNKGKVGRFHPDPLIERYSAVVSSSIESRADRSSSSLLRWEGPCPCSRFSILNHIIGKESSAIPLVNRWYP
jgi:hypothetical protein